MGAGSHEDLHGPAQFRSPRGREFPSGNMSAVRKLPQGPLEEEGFRHGRSLLRTK